MPQPPRKTIVVAGASGLIGRALPTALGTDYNLIGITRQRLSLLPPSDAPFDYIWREADLFSRKQTLMATDGADIAIYLVHSMRPSAALTQGHIRDLDLLCADNFARAAQQHGIQRIICISSLSASNEIEKTLAAKGANVCVLRASIILGPGGDRTEILLRLLKKHTHLILPAWTQIPIRPIACDDLVQRIHFALEHHQYTHGIWNVPGPDTTTFAQMLQLTAESMHLKRTFYHVGISAPRISSRWIASTTGLPHAMIQHTLESLRQNHPTNHPELPGLHPTPLKTTLSLIANPQHPTNPNALPAPAGKHLIHKNFPNKVRSVQRLLLPTGHDAQSVASTYTRWLPRLLWPFLSIQPHRDSCIAFRIRTLPWPLLILELDQEISQPDRQLFWIRGGLLAGIESNGRLEFREVLDSQYILAAIHEFRPRLPWLTYLLTQARIHLLVMFAFGQYLKKVDKAIRSKQDRSTEPNNTRG